MKKPFEVGEKIKFYGAGWIFGEDQYAACEDSCKVVFLSEGHLDLRVKNEVSGREYLVHSKQCRRLKVKARREWWINVYAENMYSTFYTSKKDADDRMLLGRIECIRVREFREKK